MDITRVFKSKARQAIFRLYFTNPEKSFYLRELERELGIPVSMLRKELITLEKEGVFSSLRQGNLLYYSLNKEYPIYNEIKAIIFKTIGIQGTLSKTLLPLKDIEVALIYGSYAKSSSNAKSDVDLFIIGNPNEDTLVEKVTALEKNLKRQINYNIYSRADFEKNKKNKESFIEDILKNKKLFLIGGENDL